EHQDVAPVARQDGWHEAASLRGPRDTAARAQLSAKRGEAQRGRPLSRSFSFALTVLVGLRRPRRIGAAGVRTIDPPHRSAASALSPSPPSLSSLAATSSRKDGYNAPPA